MPLPASNTYPPYFIFSSRFLPYFIYPCSLRYFFLFLPFLISSLTGLPTPPYLTLLSYFLTFLSPVPIFFILTPFLFIPSLSLRFTQLPSLTVSGFLLPIFNFSSFLFHLCFTLSFLVTPVLLLSYLCPSFSLTSLPSLPYRSLSFPFHFYLLTCTSMLHLSLHSYLFLYFHTCIFSFIYLCFFSPSQLHLPFLISPVPLLTYLCLAFHLHLPSLSLTYFTCLSYNLTCTFTFTLVPSFCRLWERQVPSR